MTEEPPESVAVSRSKGGLFRRFILPQILIVTAAGMAGLLWEASKQRQLDERRMIQVASSNAAFLKQVKIPQSREMAENLSVITGSRVGFFLPEEGLVEGWYWSPEEQEIARLAKAQEPGMVTRAGLRALCQPIGEGRGSIVVIESAGPLFALFKNFTVVPFLSMTLVAIAAAFLIARSVVGPLQRLAHSITSDSSETPMQLSAQLTGRHDEIGILARTLVEERSALLAEQQLRRNAEKMALLGQLATSLAHEIKNPAGAIIMHAKALENQGHQPEGSLIREDGEHITSLVNQWLFVAKPEPPRSSKADLVALLQALRDKLHPLLDFHRCELALLGPHQLFFHGDSQRIEQAFRNLIDNAVKAMPKGGKITLDLSTPTADQIQFTLTDEGPGFSASAIEHFGETFYSEREGGMGLGLALAKGVIESHGGTLSVRNLPEGGACLTGILTKPSHPSRD